MIERAYTLGEKLGIAVWTEDEAGPYQTTPYLGASWQPEGKAALLPHEYFRDGTAKMLTLFHPATGELRVKGVTSTANVVLHPWLKQELNDILAALPEPALILNQDELRELWESWREGLTSIKTPLPEVLPPLRMLLVMDNLTGHYTVDFVQWLFEHGILPLYTPLGGSWLNMAESIQRIIKRRALDGCYPKTPAEIIDWLEATAKGWNANPTPFGSGDILTDGNKRDRVFRRQKQSHSEKPYDCHHHNTSLSQMWKHRHG